MTTCEYKTLPGQETKTVKEISTSVWTFKVYTSSKTFINGTFSFEETRLKIEFKEGGIIYVPFENITDVYYGKTHSYFQSEEFKNTPSSLLFVIQYCCRKGIKIILCVETPSESETKKYLITLKNKLVSKEIAVEKRIEDETDEQVETYKEEITDKEQIQIFGSYLSTLTNTVDLKRRTELVNELKEFLPNLKKLVNMIEEM